MVAFLILIRFLNILNILYRHSQYQFIKYCLVGQSNLFFFIYFLFSNILAILLMPFVSVWFFSSDWFHIFLLRYHVTVNAEYIHQKVTTLSYTFFSYLRIYQVNVLEVCRWFFPSINSGLYLMLKIGQIKKNVKIHKWIIMVEFTTDVISF